jgi:hypothetical protein
MHTSEPLIPEPSSFEVEIAIENPKRYKLTGTDQSGRTDMSRRLYIMF